LKLRQKIKHVHSRGDVDTDKFGRHCYIRKCLNCGTRIRSYGDDKRYCNPDCANARREATYNDWKGEIKELYSMCLKQLTSDEAFVVL
jgi:hypothetical protein